MTFSIAFNIVTWVSIFITWSLLIKGGRLNKKTLKLLDDLARIRKEELGLADEIAADYQAKFAELSDIVYDAWDSLHSFKLYAPAVKDMGHMDVLHSVGHQYFGAGNIQSAAEIWDKCDAAVKKYSIQEPKEEKV